MPVLAQLIVCDHIYDVIYCSLQVMKLSTKSLKPKPHSIELMLIYDASYEVNSLTESTNANINAKY